MEWEDVCLGSDGVVWEVMEEMGIFYAREVIIAQRKNLLLVS